MKNIFCFIIILFIFVDIAFGQSGWQSQTLNSSYSHNAIYFFTGSTGYIAGGRPYASVFYKTTNSGNNWIIQNTGVPMGIYKILFINQTTGFLISGYYPISAIFKSTDAGTTWQAKNPPTSYAYFDACFVNNNTGIAVGDWGSIIKTVNCGETWTVINSCTNDYLQALCFVNENTGYSCGRASQIIKTTNGGNSWFYLIQGSGTNWLSSIKFFDTNTGYIFGDLGKFMKTSDGGSSWLLQTINPAVNLYGSYFLNKDTGYVCGSNGTILYTSNAGQNWLQQSTGITSDIISIKFVNKNSGFAVGEDGKVLKTTSGGFYVEIPVLISPPNGATNVILTPALQWNIIPGAANYHLQVSTVPNFEVITDSVTTSATQYTIPAGKLNTATTYFWRANVTKNSNTSPWSDIWYFSTVTTGITKTEESAASFRLYQNYPNPFNAATRIKFSVPNDARENTTLKIIDIQGKEVSVLIDNYLKTGVYEYHWNSGNLPSGVYYVVLINGSYSMLNKAVILK